MIFIKQITTVEELWNTAGAPTGQIAVDAVVDYVKQSLSAELLSRVNFYTINSLILKFVIRKTSYSLF